MPSERSFQALLDIKDNIVLAARWAAGKSAGDLDDDRQLFYALTRCLEIISEASRHLSPDVRTRHADIPWRDIADAGNIYRHAYDGVREAVVIATIEKSLPILEKAVDAEIARSRHT